MKKIIIICLFFNTLFINNANATNDILNNFNETIESIEETITTLTSQSEERDFSYKQQISSLEQDITELKTRLSIQELEIQNIKNIVNMLINQKINDDVPTPQSINDKEETNSTTQPINPDLLLPTAQDIKNTTEGINFINALETFNSKNYQLSAKNFADNIKLSPSGEYFHQNLLLLGMSLKEINNKNNACSAFIQILNSTETVEQSIKDKAREQYTIAQCNNTNDNN